MCSGLPEPMSRSELAAARQCLKFCDDKPSVATLITLNNLRDLGSDYSRPIFWFSELRHIGTQVSDSVLEREVANKANDGYEGKGWSC